MNTTMFPSHMIGQQLRRYHKLSRLLTVRRHGIHNLLVRHHKEMPLLRPANFRRQLVLLAPRPHVLRSRRTVDVWGVERAQLVRLQDALCDPPNMSGDGMVWRKDLALELLE